MRLYQSLGRPGAALRQYQLCVDALKRELSTAPEAETRALYEQILHSPGTHAEHVEGSRPERR